MNHFHFNPPAEASKRPERYDLHERGTFTRMKEVQQQETAALNKHVVELKSIIEEKERHIGELEATVKEVRATELVIKQAPTIIRMSDAPVTQVVYKTDPGIVDQNSILSQELAFSLVGPLDQGGGAEGQTAAPAGLARGQ